MVLAGGANAPDDFADAYDMLTDEGLPIYVTADSVLHLYHLIFDGSLMALETQHLIPLLGRLMASLREEARGALGGSLSELHRTYHIPISNTASAIQLLENRPAREARLRRAG